MHKTETTSGLKLASVRGSLHALSTAMQRAVPDCRWWAEHSVNPAQRQEANLWLLEARVQRYSDELRRLQEQLDSIAEQLRDEEAELVLRQLRMERH